MLRVAEFEYSPIPKAKVRPLEFQINEFFENAGITRQSLIDIKYAVADNESSMTYYAMVIYDND